MILVADLLSLITRGEGAKAEFKRDDDSLRPEHIAKEIVSFANMNGGKLKQRMLAGTVEGVENLAPGDPIYSPQRPDQKAGLVVDTVETGAGQYTFSTTAPSNRIEDGTLLVGSASSPALARIALPYSVSMEQLR